MYRTLIPLKPSLSLFVFVPFPIQHMLITSSHISLLHLSLSLSLLYKWISSGKHVQIRSVHYVHCKSKLMVTLWIFAHRTLHTYVMLKYILQWLQLCFNVIYSVFMHLWSVSFFSHSLSMTVEMVAFSFSVRVFKSTHQFSLMKCLVELLVELKDCGPRCENMWQEVKAPPCSQPVCMCVSCFSRV